MRAEPSHALIYVDLSSAEFSNRARKPLIAPNRFMT
jgi:hypothetical protein